MLNYQRVVHSSHLTHQLQQLHGPNDPFLAKNGFPGTFFIAWDSPNGLPQPHKTLGSGGFLSHRATPQIIQVIGLLVLKPIYTIYGDLGMPPLVATPSQTIRSPSCSWTRLRNHGAMIKNQTLQWGIEGLRNGVIEHLQECWFSMGFDGFFQGISPIKIAMVNHHSWQ